MKPTLKITDEGVLYRNLYPGDFCIHAFNPRVVELAPGRLLCAYRRSSCMYGDHARTWLLASSDNGKTWSDAGCAYDGEQDERSYSYSASNLSRFRDGTLAITGFRFHRPAPDKTFFNERTGGVLDFESVVLLSDDEGKTWSAPRIVKAPGYLRFIAYESILELENGDWLLSGEHYRAYDDSTPYNPRVFCLISSDRGESWNTVVEAAGGESSEKAFWHMRVAHAADGRLIGFPWTGLDHGRKSVDLHRVTADASGREWSEPVPTGIKGQTNRPVALGGDLLGMVVSIRETSSPGIFMALSYDNGMTWDAGNLVQVWDAYGKDSIGVPRTDTYPSSHDNIGFGAPDVLRLSNGDIYAGYWALQLNQTVCRWCRLALA